MPEAEYLIKPSDPDEWLTIPGDSLEDVLIPLGYEAHPGAGWGDLHLHAADYEISFSMEEFGWYVGFDGNIGNVDTDALVGQVARQVRDFTRTATYWIRVT